MIRRARSCSAFTLLEVLVALALMGILAGALYAGLRIGFSSRTRAEERLRPARAAATALDLVQRDIASAAPPVGVLAGPFIGTDAVSDASTGDADTLVFFAAIESSDAGAPLLRKIEFALDSDDAAKDATAGQILVRRVTRDLLASQTPDPEEEVLCRNVRSFNIAYYDGTSWLDVWDSTTRNNALPVAVELRITLRLPDTSGRAPEADYALTRTFIMPCGVASDTATAETSS